MPFLLLRQWTLPDNPGAKILPRGIINKNKHKLSQSIWSVTKSDHPSQFDQTQSKQDITNRSRALHELQINNLKQMEFEKQISQNPYTINISENHQIDTLPILKNITVAQKLLVPRPAFQHFKTNNSKHGLYHSALHQFEKTQQSRMFRLNIEKKVKVKTRKNVYEIIKRQKSEESQRNTLVNFQNLSLKSTTYLEPIKEMRPTRQILSRRRREKGNKSQDKWKLGDFFDPIMQNETDAAQVDKMKQKMQIVNNLKRITNECEKIENQHNIKMYLDLFYKFNEKVESKLIKKQKQLNKIQTIFRKTVDS